MNPQSITAQLAPLRAPDPISWWPPAPGWWLLALLALAVLLLLARALWRFHRRGAPLRAARGTVEALRNSSAGLDERTAELARLQRQLAIRFAGRRACAGLTGAAWAEFLNSLAPSGEFYFDATLTDLPYRGQVTEEDWKDLVDATSRWLVSLERPA